MAIQLYKKGNTHEVRGIQCEVKNFQLDELEYQLKEGWVKDPSELIDKESNVVEFKKSDPSHPVRVAAKEADIEGWDSKRIETLEKALDVNEN